MSSASFDKNIDGIQFTFCPVSPEEGKEEQVTVMTEDHIFRMQKSEDQKGFSFVDKDVVPDDLQALQERLSDVLQAREEGRD